MIIFSFYNGREGNNQLDFSNHSGKVMVVHLAWRESAAKRPLTGTMFLERGRGEK